jgi:uncharacterized protein YaiI (UPF0178 family)
LLEIYIDADACPVKKEVYRVAGRYDLPVFLVTNKRMRLPQSGNIRLVVVDDHLDAADDWIAEHAGEDDIVVTADIPLASRCLESGARVLGTTGRPFTEENIGDALATRELLSHLRDAGAVAGGPAPFGKKDRSRFLQNLDEIVQSIRRKRARENP